jgi:hypothetical protein
MGTPPCPRRISLHFHLITYLGRWPQVGGAGRFSLTAALSRIIIRMFGMSAQQSGTFLNIVTKKIGIKSDEVIPGKGLNVSASLSEQMGMNEMDLGGCAWCGGFMA